MTFDEYMRTCKLFGLEQILDDYFGFRQYPFITWDPWYSCPKAICKKDLKNYQIEDEKFIYHSSSEDDFCGKYDKYKQLDEFKKYLNNFVLWYKDINQKYKLEKIQKDFK